MILLTTSDLDVRNDDSAILSLSCHFYFVEIFGLIGNNMLTLFLHGFCMDFRQIMRRLQTVQHPINLSALSDQDLWRRCRLVGGVILKYRNQFLGMLPEIERRKLYRKYGMHSVHEFAGRLAGISREIVDEVLRINERLREVPKLQTKLHRGEVSWSKLQIIASVVQPENEDQWIEKVSTMSKAALQMYVHELKLQKVKSEAEFPAGWKNEAENSLVDERIGYPSIGQNQLFQNSRFSGEVPQMQVVSPISVNISSHVQTRETLSFSISRYTAARIRVFKDRLEKKLKRPITMEEVMEEFLRMADADGIYEESRKVADLSVADFSFDDAEFSGQTVPPDKASEQKVESAKRTSGKTFDSSVSDFGTVQDLPNSTNDLSPCVDRHPQNDLSPCVSRHIPAAIRREIFRRYRGICAFPNCNKPSKIFHHTERFSLHRIHDPDTIVPLCVPHERIVHQSLIAHEERAPSEWRILEQPDREHPKYAVDLLVRKYRKP